MTPVPYGSWPSPISAAAVARQAGKLTEARLTGDLVTWLERRPHEGGRTVAVGRSRTTGKTRDLVPADFDVRSRTHEYGGGTYLLAPCGPEGALELLFSNFADQRLYRHTPGSAERPRPVSPDTSSRDSPKASGFGATWADYLYDPWRRRVLAVCEDHRAGVRTATGSHPEPRTSIVAFDLRSEHGSDPVELVAGRDFFSNPVLSPDGRRLAWLSWDHPDMPWDATTLWVAGLDDRGRPSDPVRIAGGRRGVGSPAPGASGESIFQPRFTDDRELVFVSDRGGFWNLHRCPDVDADDASRSVTCLHERQADFGLPQWVFGMSTWDVVEPGRLVCTWCDRGEWRLGGLDLESGTLEEIATPFTVVDGIDSDSRGSTTFVAASPSRGPAVVILDADGLHDVHRLHDADPDPATLSVGESIEFETTGGRTAWAFFYPPKNDRCTAPDGERPVLLVKSHGGPTAMATNDYQVGIQFWTSRGIAVVDVNYGGSTGFGRAYRDRLLGEWGIVDVDDCVAAARHLVQNGRADGERLAIRGGSAGGYTTLAALAFRDVFRAGASHYGVGDLVALLRDTHKFEARYLDGLIGPWPEQQDLYAERAPIHATDRLSCPVIFFQGLEDRIVPPNQAEAMVAALREKGIPVAYVPFEGEQHGFRRSENIERALEAELYFYSRVFGFEPADEIEPVEIENLDDVHSDG